MRLADREGPPLDSDACLDNSQIRILWFFLFFSKNILVKQVDLLDRGSTLIMRFEEGVFSFSRFRDISKDSLRSPERFKRLLGVLVLLIEARSGGGHSVFPGDHHSIRVAFGEQMTM